MTQPLASIVETRSAQMFPVLSAGEIGRLRRFGEGRRYADGEALAKAGEPGHGIEILISGQVEISRPDEYLAFARERPALFEALFTLRTGLRFAEADTKTELKDAFAALAAVIPPRRNKVEVATGTFWAALHGLAELEHSGRIRESARDERVALVLGALCKD